MIVKYALKSTRALAQLGGAVVFAVLALALGISTVNRYLEETTFRAGIAELHRGDWSNAQRDLSKVAERRSHDATPRVLLGQLALERAHESAEKAAEHVRDAQSHFEKALELEGSRCSAAIGLAVAHLELSDLVPAERPAHLDEAAKALERASAQGDGEAADLQITRGAVAMARGDWKEAGTLLRDLEGGVPARAPLGSYYWHRGLLGILNRKDGAIDELRRAFLFEPGQDATRALVLALKMSCADPLFPKQNDAADLARRIEHAKAVIDQRHSRGGPRYRTAEADRAAVMNAAGIGLVAAGKLEDAEKAFQQALSNSPIETLVRMNRGWCYFLQGEKQPEDKRGSYRLSAATDFEVAGDRFVKEAGTDKAREKVLLERAVTLFVDAAIMKRWAGRDPVDSHGLLDKAKAAGLDEKEYERNLGVLYDMGGNIGRAWDHYLKAIQLHHKDTLAMQVRVDYFKQKYPNEDPEKRKK